MKGGGKKIVISKKDAKNPYYIVISQFTQQSGGVRAFHYLCHHLNCMGYPAFIVNLGKYSEYWYRDHQDICYINPDLITPILSDEIFDIHKKSNKNPIVLYTDTARGNPLRSSCVARYLLHYAGHLGGDKEEDFDDNDLIFTFSKKIGSALKKFDHDVLFMPTCNTDIFNEDGTSKERSGSCFYASKYQSTHKGKLLNITENSVEITRDLPNSQTPEQVAKLLKNSEVFYSYEDSALITESLLCGCPVVLIKNKFFTDSLASHELGTDGVIFNDQDIDLDSLRAEIPIAQEKYFEAIDQFWSQLDVFIDKTQRYSRKVERSRNLRSSGLEKIEEFTGDRIVSKRVPLGRKIKAIIKSLF